MPALSVEIDVFEPAPWHGYMHVDDSLSANRDNRSEPEGADVSGLQYSREPFPSRALCSDMGMGSSVKTGLKVTYSVLTPAVLVVLSRRKHQFTC